MAIITGTTTSRLIELRKYRRTGDLSQIYFTGGTINNDGIDILTSSADTIINYYIGGIKFIDIYDNNRLNATVFEFTITNATADNQSVNFPIIKDFSKGNVVGRPEVKSDVFITRQSLSVFERQYRLRVIDNLSQLNFYAGGGNFNIIDNI